ncbi:Protein kinase-like domain [Pseudocohnilembus persalinus]|uniref:non-specific serine/threonine protein kinase n=1 Tax=Pseudocohnilembus persalinus TaxID=266149 RepID=A0A0V0QV36_PSEPJ|nr:Protein kinase-like domain [Pseudocohnilembus persalinus]|eukprot:KRX05898.1 Protein kinase-like domain [Pseudocohnilembus persalinus]
MQLRKRKEIQSGDRNQKNSKQSLNSQSKQKDNKNQKTSINKVNQQKKQELQKSQNEITLLKQNQQNAANKQKQIDEQIQKLNQSKTEKSKNKKKTSIKIKITEEKEEFQSYENNNNKSQVNEQQQNTQKTFNDSEIQKQDDNIKKISSSNKKNNFSIQTSNFVYKQRGKYTDKYEEISNQNKLGEGSEGSVYKVKDIHCKNITRALKIVEKSQIVSLYKDEFIREIELLKTLDHPNIVKVFEFFEDEEKYYIISEYIQGRDLFDEIMERDSFPEEEVGQIAKQILSALFYTHNEKQLVHRDIKSDNILVEKDLNNENQEIWIKIIDFGICEKLEKGQNMNLQVGTQDNAAPEVIQGKNYNEKCDLWSLGCLLFTLLGMEHPFNRNNRQDDTIKNIINCDYSFDSPSFIQVSKDAKDLIQKMLTSNVDDRISAQEALKHPWIIRMNQINQQQNSDEKNQKISNIFGPDPIKMHQQNLNRFKNFHAQSKLHLASMSFIASHLTTDKEKKSLRRTFQQLDTNGDGKLSKQEILDGYINNNADIDDIQLQKKIEEINQIFENADTDNSGYIDYNEFVAAAMEKQDKFTDRKMQQVFNLFDKDGDGTITLDEIKQIFTCHIDKLEDSNIWQEIAQDVDENGDGLISLEEFKKFMYKMVDFPIQKETLSLNDNYD